MNEGYDIVFSKPSYEDLEDIYSYISFVLLSPTSAKRTIDGILKAISSLSFMPERFAAVEGLFWGKTPIRRMMVEHYSVYYAVFKESLRVLIAGITHKGRLLGATRSASA